MQAIICVKIGENALPTEARYNLVYKHLDIIDILTPKYDKDGNLRGMGVQGDKQFLGIVAEFGDITQEEFSFVRSYLRAEDISEDVVNGKNVKVANNRRLHKLDINLNLTTALLFEKTHTDDILNFSSVPSKDVDISHLNDYKKIVDFTDLAKSILHKTESKSIYEKFSLDTMSIKSLVSSKLSSGVNA
jgi:hypothetical protein